MRTRSVAALLVLLAAASGCSSKPGARARGPSPASIDETVAPQSPAPSGVELKISSPDARTGAFSVQVTLSGSARAWTAAHAWLDRSTDRGWETVWLLDTDAHSLSVDDFRRGGAALNTLGIRVPGTLALTLQPRPPSGRYRLRVAVFSGPPETEGGVSPAWAIGTIEIR